MLPDYNSLLLAIGFAGIGLVVTMIGTWVSARTDGFLLTWAVGIGLIVVHVFTYSAYVDQPSAPLQAVAFSLLVCGLSILLSAAFQFRYGHRSAQTVAVVIAASVGAVATAALLGFSGVALVVANLIAAGLMLATARQYWIARVEAPLPVTALAVLYAAIGLSFIPCALVVLAGGQYVIEQAPQNWAEDLNAFVSITGITGIGALTLALNQWRLAGRHRREALTDPLTGLLNRRALFDRFGLDEIDRRTGVLTFDLDHFKRVNDEFGHGVGDHVLRRFAMVLSDSLRGSDVAARIGGEEFVAILPNSTPERAHQVAERIRTGFAGLVLETDKGSLQCTVSVGIAFSSGDVRAFEQVLGDADRALYRAKNGGRNRIAGATLRLAG